MSYEIWKSSTAVLIKDQTGSTITLTLAEAQNLKWELPGKKINKKPLTGAALQKAKEHGRRVGLRNRRLAIA